MREVHAEIKDMFYRKKGLLRLIIQNIRKEDTVWTGICIVKKS